MSGEHTLPLPSQVYNPQSERLRNRRIEEVIRRSETNINDALRAQILPAAHVGDLPTGLKAGVRSFVIDATANTFNAALAGGGTYAVPVFFDGTVWRVG